MTEDQDLLAKISQLAGQINQHKNQTSHGQAPHSTRGSHPSYNARHQPPTWAPYRGRGGYRRPASHRNRTLVLNSSKASASDSADSSAVPSDTDRDVKSGSSNGWVAKRDRHMQLINSAIYDQEAQARTKAIEESRKLKAERRALREQAKVMSYAQGSGRKYPVAVPASNPSAANAPGAPTAFQILVNDIPFRVARGGSKLIRLSGALNLSRDYMFGTGLPSVDDPSTANNTPKRVSVGGVPFVRSKNGNLHRLGAVVSKRKPTTVKKRNELCKRFTRTGTCYKGPSCPFIHDPNKVAICKDFLQTGECNAGLNCDLSHEPSPHRSPVCVHFLRGRCSNPACRYSHVRVTPGAPVCRDFAVLGYCEKGDRCEERHVHECPDYANNGSCHKKKCTLPHVDRAGQIRKNAANKTESPPPGEEDDISSEEEDYDEIDSDDVDSDDMDEDDVEVISGAAAESELSGQQDFVHF